MKSCFSDFSRYSNLISLRFQSTPLCGERHYAEGEYFIMTSISIHAPRAGSDLAAISAAAADRQFQSTLPVRGATSRRKRFITPSVDFNPRSPCGERRKKVPIRLTRPVISIHAPRTGSDPQRGSSRMTAARFQSTLPARGATRSQSSNSIESHDFNPRSPHGERLFALAIILAVPLISIHAPRAGSDLSPARPSSNASISIHAPRAGSDAHTAAAARRIYTISIHAPRAGSDARWSCS